MYFSTHSILFVIGVLLLVPLLFFWIGVGSFPVQWVHFALTIFSLVVRLSASQTVSFLTKGASSLVVSGCLKVPSCHHSLRNFKVSRCARVHVGIFWISVCRSLIAVTASFRRMKQPSDFSVMTNLHGFSMFSMVL